MFLQAFLGCTMAISTTALVFMSYGRWRMRVFARQMKDNPPCMPKFEICDKCFGTGSNKQVT